MKKVAALVAIALVAVVAVVSAKILTDNIVNIDLTNCSYDDTYTLNLSSGGPINVPCVHGVSTPANIGSATLVSVTVHGTTIGCPGSGTASRGSGGGSLSLVIMPSHPPISDEINVTVTDN